MSENLLTPSEARRQILDLCHPLPPELTTVAEAVGCTLGETILARRTLPPWDTSAMDGYAVRASDCASGAARLRIVETVHAGQLPTVPVRTGESSRIMTGAPIPSGADSVVMQ